MKELHIIIIKSGPSASLAFQGQICVIGDSESVPWDSFRHLHDKCDENQPCYAENCVNASDICCLKNDTDIKEI